MSDLKRSAKMKKTATISIVLAVIALPFVIHFASIVRWDGGRDIALIIEPTHLAAKIVRVSYWSNPYKNLQDLSQIDPHLDKVFPSNSLQEAGKDEQGRYQIIARGSGQRSLLWTDYEYWCDGFVIRIDLSDGSSLTLLERVEPKAGGQLTIKTTEPNQAPEPTTTAVTPPAAQEPRQL
jgi:hypothetical protein